MHIFDGTTRAEEREAELISRVAELQKRGVQPQIAALLYAEDSGSRLYTRLKKEAAERVGIEYRLVESSLQQSVDRSLDLIDELNADEDVTGIIIQKPARSTWQRETSVQGPKKAVRQAFRAWWQVQTGCISLEKDVDGLHPETLEAIKDGSWQERGLVLPATVRATLTALDASEVDLSDHELQVAILGRSDILGQPLFWEIQSRGARAVLYGSKDMQHLMETGQKLKRFDVVVSATGRAGLITGDMVKEGVVLIDVGEPKADVDRESVGEKPSFLTPVPGGIGPLTVVSLLENAVGLVAMSD